MINFGTGGFRAIIAEEFTKQNIQKIAQALAIIIKKENAKKKIVIGHDRRFLGNKAMVWFCEVMTGNDIEVLAYTVPIPTPAVMFKTREECNDYGVMITASHNPYDYNGIKIFTKGGKDADLDVTKKIEKFANKNCKIKTKSYSLALLEGLITEDKNISDYLENILNFVSPNIQKNNLKVLFNAMNGVTAEYSLTLAKMLKIKKFDVVNYENDAYFGHKLPSPNEKTLVEFAKTVVDGGYDIGLASDGDGDRLAVVDEKGNIHNCNIIMAIVYYYLIKHRNQSGDMVINNASSEIFSMLSQKLGQNCFEVPVGFKWITSKMIEKNALLGGESSGGLTLRGYILGKDGLFSSSLILDVLSSLKKPFTEIIKEVKEFCNYNMFFFEESISVASKEKINNFLAKTNPKISFPILNVSLKDGFKYYFENGSWLLIRFSGTEPILRIFVEAQSQNQCIKIFEETKSFLLSI